MTTKNSDEKTGRRRRPTRAQNTRHLFDRREAKDRNRAEAQSAAGIARQAALEAQDKDPPTTKAAVGAPPNIVTASAPICASVLPPEDNTVANLRERLRGVLETPSLRRNLIRREPREAQELIDERPVRNRDQWIAAASLLLCYSGG